MEFGPDTAYLPQHFESVKDSDEYIHWIGKPAFLPFMLTGIPFLVFGLVWGVIDYFFIVNMTGDMLWFAIPFFSIHAFPCYGSVLNMIRLWLVHGNTFYAITSKRLMLRSGFWGTDFKAVDYGKIVDLEVNVNPIENMIGVGTIRAFSGNTTSKGGKIFERFVAVQNPYEVFRKIKEVSTGLRPI